MKQFLQRNIVPIKIVGAIFWIVFAVYAWDKASSTQLNKDYFFALILTGFSIVKIVDLYFFVSNSNNDNVIDQ